MPNDTRLNYKNSSKFYLLLCELHNPWIHGYSSVYSDPKIYTHYIVLERFDGPTKMSIYDLFDQEEYSTDTEYDSDDSDFGVDTIYNSQAKNIYQTAKQWNKKYRHNMSNYNNNHPSIRNYKHIISRPNYIKPEIAEYITLPTQEVVAILKTFWIRIIQRAWKKTYHSRKNVIRKRCCPGAISTFQLTGKWPEHCSHLPGLKGLLAV
jgi:hypothetical protein